jgi:hypothetical protein
MDKGLSSHSNRAGVLTLAAATDGVGRTIGEHRANLDPNGTGRQVLLYEGITWDGDSRLAKALSNASDVWYGGIGPFVEDCILDPDERRIFFSYNDLILKSFRSHLHKGNSRLQSLMTLILVRWYPDIKEKYGSTDPLTIATEANAIEAGISMKTLTDWALKIKGQIEKVNELGLPVSAGQPFGLALHQVNSLQVL